MRLLPFLLAASLLAACDPPDEATGPDAGLDPEDDEPADQAPDVVDTAAPVALAPGCVARGTLAGHDVWLFFTRPTDPCRPDAAHTAGLDTNAIAELTRLIDSVPAGGRIDGHIFSITNDGVAKALLRAQDDRGVRVYLSTDGQVGHSHDSSRTYLDQLDHHVYCGDSRRTSCIGTADGAISHTKLFVFSAAVAPDGSAHDRVAWFGSANQTQASGMKLFNNTVTVYGDATLYDGFRTYLGDLYAQRRHSDYYDPSSGRGHILAGAADAYASPETSTDLVVHRLDDLSADSDCRVRVMQASVRDSRLAVVERLVALKHGGCKVWVVASTVEPHARAALAAANIPVRINKMHDKAFIVHARYGGRLEDRVYTGSHNLSGGANGHYDEIFVKLAAETDASRPIYDAYVRHFDDAWSTAHQ